MVERIGDLVFVVSRIGDLFALILHGISITLIVRGSAATHAGITTVLVSDDVKTKGSIQFASRPTSYLNFYYSAVANTIFIHQIKRQYRCLCDSLSNGGGVTIGIQSPTHHVASIGCNQTSAIVVQQAISLIPEANGINYLADAVASCEVIDISGLTPFSLFVARRHSNTYSHWTWVKISGFNTCLGVLPMSFMEAT
ncbi:MAG: hypothetical protein QE265_01380 [Rhodoferax sp.]|nr:hypothetical protein [Rhodoferax sp.]